MRYLKMYNVKKIILHIDRPKGHNSFKYYHDLEFDYPYVAGSPNLLVNVQAKSLDEAKFSEVELFNDRGLAKLALPVGANGIYILNLRPKYCLKQLTIDPIEVVPDIFFNLDFNKKTSKWDLPNDRLLYCFYNPTRRESISISCKLVEDIDNIYSKLLTNPDDLYWRQYFINNAMMRNDDAGNIIRPVRDLMNQDQLADYLQVSKKTIQNWTAYGKIQYEKIPGTGEVRYRKADIDLALKTKIIRKKSVSNN